MKFKDYIKMSDNCILDVNKTLKKIPASHSKLIKDYKIIFEPFNALKNDKNHIGFIDEKRKTITICSPWNYGREFTMLHEIGHAVWKFIVSPEQKKDWDSIFNVERKKNKKIDQNSEETFCMTYAQKYAKNKMEKFENNKLLDFISNL